MIHPLTRIILVACLAVCSITFQTIHELGYVLALNLLLILLLVRDVPSRVTLVRQLRRLLPVVFSLFILQLIFNRRGNVLINLGGFKLYDWGVITAVTVTMRLLILLLSGSLLWNLPSRQYIIAMHSARIPESFSIQVLLTLRSLPQLTWEVRQSLAQIRLRGIPLKKISLMSRLRLYLGLLLPILGWTLKDLQYQAIALDMKGFRNGRKHTQFRQKPMKQADYLISGTAILATLVAVL